MAKRKRTTRKEITEAEREAYWRDFANWKPTAEQIARAEQVGDQMQKEYQHGGIQRSNAPIVTPPTTNYRDYPKRGKA